jgi:hypothetical protein
VPRRDLILLVVLVVVVVTLAAVVGGADRGAGAHDPRPSTHLTGPGGTAALFWTLQELGIPVARRGVPLVAGPPPRGDLALLAPASELTPAEVAIVLERVRAGGMLVYAASVWSGGEDALHDSLRLVTRPTRGRAPEEARAGGGPAGRHPWLAGVDTVAGFRAVFADTSAALAEGGGARILLRHDRGAAAVVLTVGAGTVLALADAEPLTNARLRGGGAATVLARAAAASGDTLWFDEFHHGFRDDGADGIGALRRVAAVLPTAFWLHLAALAALALLLAGRRFGAPHPVPPVERRSPLEHVEALAGAYRQGGARRTARRLLVAGLARRLGRRVPADDAAADAALERLAHGTPAAAAEVERLRGAWRRGHDADLAEVSNTIDRILEEVRRT